MSDRMPPWLKPAARFGLSGATSAIGAIGGIIRNKLFATALDTAGVGVLAQVISSQTWLGQLTGGGLSLPLSYEVARARGANDQESVRRAVWTVLVAVASVTTVVCSAGLLLAPALSTAVLGTPAHATLVRISLIAVAGLAAQLVLQGLYAGYADVRTPFTYIAIGNLAATSAVLVLAPRIGIAGAVIGVACFFPPAIVGSLWIHRDRYASAFRPAPRPRFDSALFGRMLRLAAAGLLVALFDQGVLIAARAHCVRVQGASANGLLQAALALSQQSGGLFYAYLGGYAFGRVSGMEETVAIRDYSRRQWRVLMSAAALLCAFMIVAGDTVVHLLFSDRFAGARGLLAWMVVGEFCKVCMYVWGLSALRLAGVKRWAAMGFGYTSAVGVGYVVATRLGAGLYALPYAYAVAGAVGLVLAGTLMTRRGVTLAGRDFAILALCLTALVMLAMRFGRP